MPGPDVEQQLAALRQGYAERLPERAARLEADVAALVERWDDAAAGELRRALHNLAGSGATYGFPEVSRAARAGEDACAAAIAADPAGAVAAKAALQRAVAALAQVVATGT
jgi:chemotaxis protein histidine kinase CheA